MITMPAFVRAAVLLAAAFALTACLSPEAKSARKGVPGTAALPYDLLAHAESEEAGYGAYSYVIFTAPPTDARTQALLKAYLQYLPPITLYEHGTTDRRKDLHIVYVPVDARPESGVSLSAEWLGAHYDLGRAQVILMAYQLRGNGPYIVTASQALGRDQLRAASSSVLDLSNASDEVMGLWTRQFVNESTQPERWIFNGASGLALRFHDALAEVGAAAKLTKTAFHESKEIVNTVFAEK